MNGAVKNLRQNLMEQINSVLTNASQRIGFIQELTMKKGFAKNVDANLLSTNTTKMNIAAENAHQNTIKEICLKDVEILEESSQRVFDLEIDGEHEYFANGILAHNCLDAFRYWVMCEIMGRIIVTKNYSKEDLGL